MNELHREQRPLLYEELSDDDFGIDNYSPRSNKYFRAITKSGQAKNQMKGAANIFKTWPDLWWLTVKYWWIGLGMIAITVLIIYNSVVAFSMLPMPYTKTLKSRTLHSPGVPLPEHVLVPDIYMHVFAENKDEVNLNDFLPYVQIISKRYPNFKFNLIVVINDLYKDIESMNDESKNHLALDSLWADIPFSNDHIVVDSNLVISYVSINSYLGNPAFHKITEYVSKEFIEFIVRLVTIWEKSGIVLNPTILTPRSPNALYMERIENVLNDYKMLRLKKIEKPLNITRQFEVMPKTKHVFNNIRDIINALEEDEKFDNGSQYNLTGTEDKIVSVTIASKGNLIENKNINPSTIMNIQKDNKQIEINHVSSTDRIRTKSNNSRNPTQSQLLPLFLKVLSPKSNDVNSGQKRDKRQRTDSHDSLVAENSYPFSITKKVLHDTEENALLTIDLKGNIIASNTPCHAFIGNLLRNAAHYTKDKTVTEFITAELTAFCKGVLSSCKGIDVILV